MVGKELVCVGDAGCAVVPRAQASPKCFSHVCSALVTAISEMAFSGIATEGCAMHQWRPRLYFHKVVLHFGIGHLMMWLVAGFDSVHFAADLAPNVISSPASN